MMIPSKRPTRLEEIKALLSQCSNEEMDAVLGMLSSRVLIPYWLIPEESLKFQGGELSKDDFPDFLDWFNVSDFSSEVEQLLSDEWLPAYKDE